MFDQNTEEIQNAFKFAMMQHSAPNRTRLDFQLYVDVINTADAFKLSRLSKWIMFLKILVYFLSLKSWRLINYEIETRYKSLLRYSRCTFTPGSPLESNRIYIGYISDLMIVLNQKWITNFIVLFEMSIINMIIFCTYYLYFHDYVTWITF